MEGIFRQPELDPDRLLLKIHVGDWLKKITVREFVREYCKYNAEGYGVCENYLEFVNKNKNGMNRQMLCFICSYFQIHKLQTNIPRKLENDATLRDARSLISRGNALDLGLDEEENLDDRKLE